MNNICTEIKWQVFDLLELNVLHHKGKMKKAQRKIDTKNIKRLQKRNRKKNVS